MSLDGRKEIEMAVTTDDLEAFHRFAEAKIDCGQNDFSFDELVEQWLLQESRLNRSVPV